MAQGYYREEDAVHAGSARVFFDDTVTDAEKAAFLRRFEALQAGRRAEQERGRARKS